jgi:hypothetical protein
VFHNASSELSENYLGNAARLNWSCESWIIAVSCYYLGSGPSPPGAFAKSTYGCVVAFPVFVGFLQAKDGGGQVAVEVERGAEFGNGRGWYRVDIMR